MLGMFLEWNNARESSQYTVAIVNIFPKVIDPERLVRAVESAAADNEMFKARFILEDEAPRWLIDESIEIKVSRGAMSDVEADVYQQGFARGFDAFKGPFVRFSLIETPKTYRLFTEIFHVVVDGTSGRILFDAIEANYSADAAVAQDDAAAHVPFADYVAAEQASFNSPEYIEARDAAQKRFAGRSMSLPEGASKSGGGHPLIGMVRMPRAEIDAYCRKHELHPNLFFLGVFARTLALYTNEKDVVFWTVNHGRGKTEEWKRTYGCFVKSVPVLGEMKGELSCVDYFRAFKLHKAGVYPFTHFCRDLGITPGWGMVYQEGTTAYDLTLDGVKSGYLSPMTGGSGENPVVQVFGEPESIRFEITCMDVKYGLDFITGFAERMKVIAQNFATARRGKDSAAPVNAPSPTGDAESLPLLKDVSVLTADETDAVLKLSYGGEMEYDESKTFVDLFREQTASRPDATAVVDRETSLTYRQLDQRSDALASLLVERGVKPGDFVAVKLPRRVSFAVAIIAVQKCGAGYVPLDPEYPQDRLDYMVSDSQSKLVVVESGSGRGEVVVQSGSGTKEDKNSNIHCTTTTNHYNYSPEGPAYMIYTSGSTGRPKGVVLSQRAVMNLIKWHERDLGVGPGKKNLHLASFSFDASVPDLFASLACGSELHILDEDTRKDLSSVGDYCVQHKITGATMSTKMGLALVNAYPELPLEYMMLGGEKMTAFAKTPVRMLNGYGPTEFTVCSSYHEVDQSRSYDIPIGKAVPNTYSFVIDKLGQLVPYGMTGEIALAGIQLSEGYWHQPEKTAKAFVEIPQTIVPRISGEPGDFRMYRTGDLGRYNAGRELEFQGRFDFQVKLRGFRIEIGEIEHVASTFPGVGGVIALVKTIAGAEHLVLYFEVRSKSEEVRVEELKAHLASKLASYMVPDYFVAMEKLPQTPGGKIDRNALPLPKTDDEPVVAPEGESETKLLECVKAVLKREDFGVMHDFNHLGLTSLGAMELVVKIKKALGVKVTMRQLAEHPSVRQLAGIWRRGKDSASPVGAAVATVDAESVPLRQETAPMTENQRGIYVDWLRNQNTTQYNIPGVVRFPDLDPRRLAAAVEKVIAAHKAFRIRFVEKDGEIVQEVGTGNGERGTVEVIELDREPDADFFASQVRPFAPSDSSLVRIKIFQSSTSHFNSYLFLDIHHTVFDGVSMGVFLNELMLVLDGGDPQGEEYALTDAAVDEEKYLKGPECAEDEKWFERYLDGVESTRLEESSVPDSDRRGQEAAAPVDGSTLTGDAASSPLREGGNCGRVTRELASAPILAFCKDHGVSPSDYLLTAFMELLKRIGRSEDVLINFVSAGRTDPSVAGTIGMFVKTLPIRGVKDAKTFAEAVSKLHLDVLDLLDRSRVSYARLSELFGVRPDILFAYEGGIFELPHGASLIEVPLDTPKAPLSVVVNPGPDDFKITFEYDRALYSAADMERLASMFATLAEGCGSGKDSASPVKASAPVLSVSSSVPAGDAESLPLLRDIPLVSSEEAEKILALSYGGDLEYDATKTFVNMFHANVITRSFATAVVDSERSLTYGELDERSNALSAALVERGVVAGDFVAVKLPRTVDFIVAVLAVQKLGAAYIPVDPAYPQDRIDYIVADSGSKLVVDENEVEKIGGGGERNGKKSESSTLQLQLGTSTDLPAYVIYTSGSTGRPKGVVVPHRALRNLIEWVCRDYGIRPGTRIATHPSFSFDASVIDIFPTLAAGGELHILADKIRKDIPAIRDYLVAHGIEGMTMSTQIGMALLDAYPDVPLRYLQVGGEKLMPVAKTKVRIINGYGPTEFCVCSSFESVDQAKEGDIPIGRAVPNTYSVIVDRYGHLLPQGCAGELALIGPQMADGYWHQPEKTAKAFTKLPAATGRGIRSRSTKEFFNLLYRTGDLARYNAEGKIEYLGRLDFQVKLRGFRIEIGEIESVAKQFPGIGAVAAEVRDVGGAKHLVLYYEKLKSKVEVEERKKSTHQLQLETSTDLKAHLADKLTDYMVPDYFVEVEKMPMTPNGKIDRRKLASPSAADSPREYVEPENDVERTVAKCYGEILKLERYGATDDFFELGGTSLVAIKAVVALQKAGLDVQYGDIFRFKTPRALARRLSGEAESLSLPNKDGSDSSCGRGGVSSASAASAPDVYADYDYTAIDKLLADTRTELFDGFRRHSLGDVLLTGATGYLGMHVLRYLLEKTDSTVYALVRTKKGVGPARRVSAQYVYYFGERIPKRHLDRLEFIEGDITDKELKPEVEDGKLKSEVEVEERKVKDSDKSALQLQLGTSTSSPSALNRSFPSVNTVINCAAMVKHYVADDLMDRINVGGVENLIAFCARTGARLIHTSTYSVGGTIRSDSFAGLDERHLYIGQDSDNDYVRTKFLAERAVLAAIAEGRIRGKIMRLGNLMGREADGEFQMNVGANAFINSLKTYKALGAYPLEELANPLEMSPIDRVAEAVCLLSMTPDDMYVFHPYNRYALDMGAVIAALNARGIDVDAVSRGEFAAHVDALRNDPTHAAELQGILHYAGQLLSNRKMAPVDNTWTTTVLYRLGFRWKPADDRYLANFFDMLSGIGAFE